MLILGAGGFARQLLGELEAAGWPESPVFFDNTHGERSRSLKKRFRVLQTEEELRAYFASAGEEFVIGVGSPGARRRLWDLGTAAGGKPVSFFSRDARRSNLGTTLGPGTTVLFGAVVEPFSKVGEGSLVNVRACLFHETEVGAFCEIAPGARLLGCCRVGDGVSVGANAVILNGVSIGAGSVIGAGAVVTRDVPERTLALGVPAKHFPVERNGAGTPLLAWSRPME